jgi:hypothetical protein
VQVFTEPKEKVPASQGVQVVAAVWLLVALPDGQVMQDPVCACGAYFPNSQLRHSTSLKLYSPALQSLQKVRPGVDSFPVSHSSQLEDPTAVLNFPASHKLQFLGHGAVALALLSLLYRPMLHSWHAAPS